MLYYGALKLYLLPESKHVVSSVLGVLTMLERETAAKKSLIDKALGGVTDRHRRGHTCI